MNPNTNGTSNGQVDNNKIITRLLVAVVIMFGFGFAMVPLYDVFCDITGLNGKTGDQIALSESMKVDTSREITVEFIASLNEEMPWEFRPLTKSVKVHPGQPTRIEYVAINKTDNKIIGQAVPSVAPGLAAAYFQKTECFCFTEQTLEAREERSMPVIFVVDPEISEDINEITLAYTFFVKPGSEVVSDSSHKLPKTHYNN